MSEPRRYLDDEFWNKKLPALKEAFAPQHVIVFGSRARGEMTGGDLDLIVVSDRFEGERFIRRALPVRDILKMHDVDIFCYTPEEFEKKMNEEGVIAQACREGAWLAGDSLIDALEEQLRCNEEPNHLAKLLKHTREYSDPEIVVPRLRFLHALDRWYRRWPIGQQNEIKERLLGRDDQYYHACYELFLHAYFYEIKKLWVGVGRDLSSKAKMPDFLIGLNREAPLCYIEVVTRMEAEEVGAADRWTDEVWDRLNQSFAHVPEGFVLTLRFEEAPLGEHEAECGRTGIAEYARRIEDWLVTLEKIPGHRYKLNIPDLRVVVSAYYDPEIPPLPEPIVRVWVPGIWVPDPPKRILVGALQRKAEEFPPEAIGDTPFVLAYGRADMLFDGNEWILGQALGGPEAITAAIARNGRPVGEPSVERVGEGVFQHPHVSGVLWMSLKPNWIEGLQLRYFPNPNAAHPLPEIPTPEGKRDLFWDCQDGPRWIPVEEML